MNMLTIKRMLDPLARTLRGMLGLGVLKLTDDSMQIQQVQITGLAGQIRSRVNRYQNYGFTSHAPNGAEPVYANLGGDPSRVVIIVLDNGKTRKKNLAEGETALYTDEGDYILLKRGRIIEVVAGAAVNVSAPEVTVTASSKVTFDSPLVECTQAFKAANVEDANGTMQEMRDFYNAHGAGAPNHPPGDMQ